MTSVAELGVKIVQEGLDATNAKMDEMTRRAEILEREVIKLRNSSQRGFKGLADAADQANKSLYAMAETAGTLVGRALNLIAGYLSVREYVRYADTWSDISARVQNAIGPHERAADVMGQLSQMARVSYSDLGITAEAFINNAQSLQELGLNTQQQLRYQEALNNALVVSGARADRAASVQHAFSSALALGALRGDQLNSVLINGDRITKSLAKELGVTTNELRALGAEGKITRNVMLRALLNDFDILRAEAEEMPATIGDAFTLINNATLTTIGTFDKFNNISATIANGMVRMADGALWLSQNVSLVSTAFFTFANVIGINLVLSFVRASGALTFLQTQLVAFRMAVILSGGGVTGLAFAIGTVLTGAITAAKTAFMTFLPTAIIQGAIIAVAYLIAKFMDVSRAVGGIGVATSLVFEAIKWEFQNFGGIVGFFWNHIKAMDQMIQAWAAGVRSAIFDATENFRTRFTQIDAQLSAIFTGLLITVTDWVISVNKQVMSGVNFIIGAFRGALHAVGALFNNLAAIIGAGVIGAVNFVIDKINQMINAAKSGINSLISAINNIPGVNIPALTVGGEPIAKIKNDAKASWGEIAKAAAEGFAAGNKTFSYEQDNAITQYRESLEAQKLAYENVAKNPPKGLNGNDISAAFHRTQAEILRATAGDQRGENPYLAGIRGALAATEEQANSTTAALANVDLPPGLGGGGGGAGDGKGGGKGKGAGGGQSEAAKRLEDQRKALSDLQAELEKYRATVAMTALEEEIWNQQKATGAAANTALGQQVAAVVTEIDTLRSRQDAMRQMAQTIEQSFGTAFQSIVTGSGSARDAVGQLIQSLANMLAQEGFQSLWSFVGKGLTSALTGGWRAPVIPANANGTPNWGGGLTSINERGGEIVDLPRGSRIYPADVSKRMASREGRQDQLKIIVEPSGDFRTEMDDRALSAAVSVQKAYNQSGAANKKIRQTIRKPRSIG